MKRLSFRSKLVARPAANIANADNRQIAALKLTPRAALIAALFCIAVSIGQPETAGDWLRMIVGGVLAVGFPMALVKFATGEWREL